MDTTKPTRTWTVHSPADLGRAIAGVRGEKGLSQAELAEELAVHRPYVTRLEGGQVPVAVERALRALRRMGATVTVSLTNRDGPEH